MINSRKDELCVYISPKDDAEYAIRKFTKKVRNSGMLQDLMDKSHYEKPSVRRKKKHEKAVRSMAAAARDEED